jgi:hypothetical protein
MKDTRLRNTGKPGESENGSTQEDTYSTKNIAYTKLVLPWLQDLKLFHKCALCGYGEQSLGLNFWHTDRVSRREPDSFSLSDRHYHTKDEVEKELGKCIVLCGTCRDIIKGSGTDLNGVLPTISLSDIFKETLSEIYTKIDNTKFEDRKRRGPCLVSPPVIPPTPVSPPVIPDKP